MMIAIAASMSGVSGSESTSQPSATATVGLTNWWVTTVEIGSFSSSQT